MTMQCETCGAENPSTNRFCGQCGRKLVASAAETPEEFYRDTEAWVTTNAANAATNAAADVVPDAPSGSPTDLPAESTETDKEVLLFADEHTEGPVEHEAELPGTLQHAGELSADHPAHEDSAASNSEEPPPASPEAETLHTGVSGPSFLGLTDGSSPDYLLYEDEPPSHARRNVALALVAAVVVLVAMQWRSVRDYSAAYIQNGSMQVKPRTRDDPRNPPAVAADNTARDLGMPPAYTKPGLPKPVEASPNADRNPIPQSSSATDAPAPAVAKAAQPPSMSAAPPDLPRNTEPQDHAPAIKPPAAVGPPPKPTPIHAAPPARNTTHSTAVPGADEMGRAARASDAEARAAWLWRAVGKGNPQAPVELARMYEQGNGVVRSCDQAQILLRLAANKGNEQARQSLQQIRARGGCSAR
jgi:hypothetical protein